MRIKELSIGDWVRYRDADAIVRVSDTYSNGYVFIVGEEDSGISESVNAHHHIEPIPLTPEILEKNGFEKGEIYEGNSSIVFTNGNIIISWYKNAMWYRLRIYNALGDTELCSAIVHNVHQLQHALRLAGVGKEIEL